MKNTRQNFEQVFRDIIVPELMDQIKSTGFPETEREWIERVRPITFDRRYPQQQN